MAEAKRRLAAILAADVAGYSRLMGDDEQATLKTLNAYRAVFRKHIGKRDGRVVDTAGDSVLAVFDSVVEAVQCAADVQADIEPLNADLPESRRMQFRIGVNLGDVIAQDDGTIYGDGVNVAARLESLAEPGGLIISGTTFDHVDGKLDIGLDLHWTLDVTLDEDSARNRKDNGPANLAVLRRLALNVARAHPDTKTSMRRKLLRAGWDQDFLFDLIRHMR